MKGSQAMKDKMAKLRAMKKGGAMKKAGNSMKKCAKGSHMMPDGKCMMDADMPKMMMKMKKMK